MAIIINKLGEHRNEDAIQLLLNYMITSSFYIASNCRGCIGSSVQDVVSSFAFTKQMYDKADRKQVSHIIIGTKNEEVTVEGLLVIAEAALNYFYSQGFQSFYVIHSDQMMMLVIGIFIWRLIPLTLEMAKDCMKPTVLPAT